MSRLIAAAEQAGFPSAGGAITQAIGRLISVPIVVNGEQTSLTAVHAYAAAVRREHLADDKALAPGLNPRAVTDAHLRAAIEAVLGEPPATA